MPFPLDEKFIFEAEAQLNTCFPTTFRGKMMKMNGGTVKAADDDWELYPFLDRSDNKQIARTCNDIVRETVKMREVPNFPPGAVVIAGNGTGDQLVMLPRADSTSALGPCVYWWNHETGQVRRVVDRLSDVL